tara:strand:+ start:232 stop:396 length:165 start_codon:yes stop_codon:yes gene_type:complete
MFYRRIIPNRGVFILKKKPKKEREYAKDRMEYFKEFHQVIAPVIVKKKIDDDKS